MQYVVGLLARKRRLSRGDLNASRRWRIAGGRTLVFLITYVVRVDSSSSSVTRERKSFLSGSRDNWSAYCTQTPYLQTTELKLFWHTTH